MAKTEKELAALKERVEQLRKELKELTAEEMRQVAGGEKDDFHWRQCPACKTWVELDCMGHGICPKCGFRWA